MADRNRYSRDRSYRDDDYPNSRQTEQFDDGSYERDFENEQRNRYRGGGQMGEGRTSRSGGSYPYEDVSSRQRGSGEFRGQDRSNSSYRGERSYYGGSEDRDYASGSGFGSFPGDGRSGPGSSEEAFRQRGGYGGEFSRERADDRDNSRFRGGRGGSDREDRGFFQKAGDQIASWFGDEDASRRVERDHRGSGPSNYTRSDSRILEDACDRLTDDWDVDARNIQATVSDGEVTLDGTVSDRGAKRRAEDCVEQVSGVKHVQNNLRVQTRPSGGADYSSRTDEDGKV